MESHKFICHYEDCQKTYKSKFNLRRHIDSMHLKLKTFQCLECLNWFVSKQNLQDHLNIHADLKPFICNEPDCNKQFRQASHLGVHRKIHEKRKEKLRRLNDFKPLLLSSIKLPKEIHDYDTPISPTLPLPVVPPMDTNRIRLNLRLPLLSGLFNNI